MIYVMSDIHGNSVKFNSVMDQIKLQPEDTLYILGDVIDRHPDGIKILRKIMTMPNVKMLLGNHEHMMLEAIAKPYNLKNPEEYEEHDYKLRVWYNNGGHETHSALKHLRKTTRAEIFEFLQTLPINLDIEVGGKKYRLAHAAPIEMYKNYGSMRYKTEKEFAVWFRLRGKELLPDDYTLIFGHTPTVYFQDDDILKIWHGNRMIGLDCGSGFPNLIQSHSHEFGRLGCLRLDDGKEFYSELSNEETNLISCER